MKFGQDGRPILQIGPLALTILNEPFEVRDQAFHRADQEVGKVDAMREHVAELAGAGEFFHLAPAEVPRAPVLQAARTVMIRPAEIASLHEVRQVAHRRDEPIGERRHVPDASLVRGVGHPLGLGVAHCQRFLAQDMFALGDGRVSDCRMNDVRRGNDDCMHVVTLHDLFVAGRRNVDAGLLASAFECRRVGVAQRDDSRLPAHCQSGQMVLKSDPAAADDGKIQSGHGATNRGAS